MLDMDWLQRRLHPSFQSGLLGLLAPNKAPQDDDEGSKGRNAEWPGRSGESGAGTCPNQGSLASHHLLLVGDGVAQLITPNKAPTALPASS